MILTLKTFEDEESVALLHKDSCQAQTELGVDHTTISKHLTTLGIIQKQGHWVLYELKPRDVKWRTIMLQWQKRKDFLHRIMTGDEKWIHYDNHQGRRSRGNPGLVSQLAAKPNIQGLKILLCIWWDQLVVVYCELLKPTETITRDHY